VTELPHIDRSALFKRFVGNRQASSAVEFAIVALPVLMLMMGVVQIGIYYIAQSSLDTGVIKTAELLRTNFTTGTTATLTPASTLKANVATAGGGMIQNNANLAVEVRDFSTLTAASVPIVDGTTDYGTNTSTIVLRAQATVPTLAPGLGALTTIRSSAMIRRQGT
jgi:Flp pilus assembly protein TadG